jgi:hypothetical protein
VDDKELMQGAYIKAPSRSYTLWENTMCNPLGDMRTQTQSAWHDGYASAKVEKEWYGLTDEEIRQLEIMEDEEEERKGWCDPKLLIAWTQALLKEKNA